MRYSTVSRTTRAFVTLACVALMSSACGQSSPPGPGQVAATAGVVSDLVGRGEYLVEIAGCHDCHTPKLDVRTQELDRTRLLAGRPLTTPVPAEPPRPGEISVSADLTAWWGPWGVTYAANLTPDPETGIGTRYTEATFVEAMRTGRKPEGEPLLPPMPWPAYSHMTDEDLRAIFVYLQRIRPVKNFVRDGALGESR